MVLLIVWSYIYCQYLGMPAFPFMIFIYTVYRLVCLLSHVFLCLEIDCLYLCLSVCIIHSLEVYCLSLGLSVVLLLVCVLYYLYLGMSVFPFMICIYTVYRLVCLWSHSWFEVILSEFEFNCWHQSLENDILRWVLQRETMRTKEIDIERKKRKSENEREMDRDNKERDRK